MTFTLHPQLAADTAPVGDLAACRVLLMNNQLFPWLILVPRRDNLRDLHELTPEDYAHVTQEVRMVSEKLAAHTGAHKMNVAALGNQVEQLHIHVIARFTQDAAWPKPVWGTAASVYNPDKLLIMIKEMKRLFNITKM